MILALNHRLLLTPDAMLRDENVESVIDRIINRVKLPMSLPKAGANGAARSSGA